MAGSLYRWTWNGKLLILPPLMVGVATLLYATSSRKTIEPEKPLEKARVMTVTAIQKMSVAPKLTSYGLAAAPRRWNALAEVRGVIKTLHPRLQAGNIISEGEILVTLDDTDYQITLSRLKSEKASIEAQLQELEKSKENLLALKTIDIQMLELYEKEYRRLKDLPSASHTEKDQAQIRYIQQRKTVQSLMNSLELLPAQKSQLLATLRAKKQLERSARRDIERTIVKAPLTGRLGAVNLQIGQVVNLNQSLVTMENVDALEIEARLPLDQFVSLMGWNTLPKYSSLSDSLTQLHATVVVRSGSWFQEWPAEVSRVREMLEPQTRTLGLIVTLKQQTGSSSPSASPLLPGTFCEVLFQGPTLANQFVVPRTAIRDEKIHILDENNRLKTLAITTKFILEEQAVIEGNLREGMQVIISDPSPAIQGMLIKPVTK